MRVFIPINFNAPLGGLQSHVRAQATALLRAGHDCTVMCKSGPFSQSLRELSIQVLETTFDDLEESAEQACRAGRYDLVHGHPFKSTAVGLQVATRQGIPFLVTFHGTYLESLPSYADKTDIVIAVSPAIRDFLLAQNACPASRIVVIPNGVDTATFRPSEPTPDDLRENVPALREFKPEPQDRRVFFVSRLDRDKTFILDVVKETWEHVQRTRSYDIVWWVAGDGTLRSEMEAAADELNSAAGRPLIAFVGWQNEEALAKLYNSSHLAIAPGRSALESMACSTSVIAIGSKGYVGLVDSETALDGVYGNFGGLGKKRAGYEPGSMFRTIDRVIYDDDELARVGDLSLAIVNAFFEQAKLDTILLQLYQLSRTMRPRSLRATGCHEAVPRPALALSSRDRPGELSSSWSYPKDESRLVTVLPEGKLQVRFSLPDAGKFYVQSGSSRFDQPPTQKDAWRLEPGVEYVFSARAAFPEGSPRVIMWVIEYDESRRVRHSTAPLSEGDNRLTVRTSSSTTCFRLAFRFSGSGQVDLSPVELFREGPTPPPGGPDTNVRARELATFSMYAGENLIFIVGPPRSGTTWVLNLLRTHPDVVAANLDNLDVRINEAQTLETNVFNDNRPFTDMQIKRKFHLLSQRQPGKVIVEKTPIHLLYVSRIRRIFPKATLLLVERDGRDVVTSLIHVARDRSSWWQGAPDTIEKASALWQRYAEAAIHCIARLHPYRMRYEELLENPHRELIPLLTALGLSTDYVERQVEATRDGKDIPIPGVFREGKTGGWQRLFSAEDVETFKRVAGDLLIECGYEQDNSWGPD